jgi:DNA-binding IclR family transcriptional regulator
MARQSGVIQSVDRAAQILAQLAGRGGCASLADLARDLELSRSTVHGLLATLRRHGLIAQDEDGRYVLGLKLFELGSLAVSRLDLRQVAGPVLERLVDQFHETVHLVLGDGLDVVYIDKRESPQSMTIVSQVGHRLPAYCTGVGKAMLAFKPEPEIDDLLNKVVLLPRTKNTITDKIALKSYLAEVRACGYALDNEEIIEGLRCVAAPIRDHTGQVVAALSVSGPSVRLTAEKIAQIIPTVVKGAADISRQLGYREEMLVVETKIREFSL